LRCLCELDEGFQHCDADGVLSECDCQSSTIPTPRNEDASTRPRFDAGPDAPTGEAGPMPRCGDGRIDVGEACDDGNNQDDDGCSARCIPDGRPTQAATCPGQAVTLWPIRYTPVLHIVGSTDGFTNTMKASCFDSKGPDRVYAITPTKDGVMSIKMNFSETFSAIVSLQDNCTTTLTASHKLFCSDTLGFPMNQLVEVKQDKTYYLVIDGDTAAAKGPFEIDLSLQ